MDTQILGKPRVNLENSLENYALNDSAYLGTLPNKNVLRHKIFPIQKQ